MRTNQKAIFIFLLTFLLLNTGCIQEVEKEVPVKVETGTVSVPDEVLEKEELINEAILMSNRYFTSLVIFDEVLLSKDKMEMLVDNNAGILKNYSEIVSTARGNQEYTGKDILTSFIEGFASPDGGGGIGFLNINMNLFTFILELKWHFITSSELTGEEIKNKLSKLVYQDFVVGDSTGKPRPQKETLKEVLEDLGFLMYEIYHEFPEKKTISFKDGTSIEASGKINKATYVIQKIAAKMADSREEWDSWFSDGENSFNSLWENFWSSNNLETKFRYKEW